MNQRGKVDGQPAYVLHTYPFRETSLIVEVFSRDFGRMALLARGARRPRSAIRGLLMAFQPLEIAWAGKGEVLTLMKAEWQGGQPLLAGEALFCGYYLNELLIHLLPREDAHEVLFSYYAHTLRDLAAGGEVPAILRRFELKLLQELGYALPLLEDERGVQVEAELTYCYVAERGPVRLGEVESGVQLSGKTLLDMAQEDYRDPQTQQQSKHMMRALMAHYLGDKPLYTRQLLMDLQQL